MIVDTLGDTDSEGHLMTSLLWYPTFWEHTCARSTLASFLSLKGRAATMTVPTRIHCTRFTMLWHDGRDLFKLKRSGRRG
jgi:hypothetical protein